MTGPVAGPSPCHPQMPPTAPSRVPQSARARVRAASFLVVGILMWLTLLDLPADVAGPQLDPSWGQSLGYFLKHRFQAGQQYIFTYGPLGYFATEMYDRDLFWYKVAWELSLKLLLVVAVFRLTSHTLTFIPRLIFCLLTAVFLACNPDGFNAFFVFLLGVSLAGAEGLSWRRLVVDTLLLATLALVKFTLLVQAVLMVSLAAGLALCRRPRVHALRPPVLFGVFLIGWWLVLGQSALNCPRYLYTSLQVAAGYNESAALDGARPIVGLAVVILGLLGAALGSQVIGAVRGVKPTLTAGVVALFLFLQWKHGFVRQDIHPIFFFTVTLLCPFLFPVLFPECRWGRWPRFVLVAGVILLSAVASLSVWYTELNFAPTAFLASRAGLGIDHAQSVLDLGGLHDRLERRKEELARRFALPQIAARVRGASVDTFSTEQGVLLLNALNWTPRPIFQGYIASTPYLQSLNAQFLASAAAPEYILFQLRNNSVPPTLDDGQALLEIFRRYHPVLTERLNLLLERNSAGTQESAEWKPVREQEVGFDQEIAVGDLRDSFLRAKVQLAYSWSGQACKLLYKPPPVFIKLRTETDQTFVYRLVPITAAGAFLLNPLLQDTSDVVDLYGTGHGKRVVAFCITAGPGTRKMFANQIRITLEAAPRVTAAELAPGEQSRLRYPMMTTPPKEVFSSLACQWESYEDRPVLLLHPAGEMRFPVKAGPHWVRGQFGILPSAYEVGRTEGVQFSVEFLPAQGSRPAVQWQRFLNPRHQAADRGIQPLHLRVLAPADGDLILRTSVPPGQSSNWGWSFWTGIAIDGRERTR